MTNFTAGPLEIIELMPPIQDWTGSRFILRAPEAPGGVCIVMGGLGEVEEKANADLYAAAPEMYEVLKSCEPFVLKVLEQSPPEGKWAEEGLRRMALVLDNLRTALAKAEGKAS